MRQISISETEEEGVVSQITINGRHWVKRYDTPEEAIGDAVSFGLIEGRADYMEDYCSEPNNWELFALLPEFNDVILSGYGWTFHPGADTDMGLWLM